MIHSKTIHSTLAPLHEQLTQHILYLTLHNEHDLRIFMQAHVFAVWDFQSLMKSLQRIFTCVEIPWLPTSDTNARRLINEIVLDEESDIAPNGGYLSHFELYLQAMQDCGADTSAIQTFMDTIKSGTKVNEALQTLILPLGVKEFVTTTMSIAESNSPHRIAAAFAYGRELVIPDMFRLLVAQLANETPAAWATFRYYLERHIQTDSERHGPQADRLISNLCGNNAQLWAEATEVASISLQARISLWDKIAISINQ